MKIYDNKRVKAGVTNHPLQVRIMQDWVCVYLTYEELADIAEAAAQHLSAAEPTGIVGGIPCPQSQAWDPLGQGGGG